MASPKLRIAIAGGGVGGVIAALALSKSENLEVVVYEAASKFGEIGVAIGIPWRPWTVLKLLGLQQYLVPLLPKDQIPRDEMVPTVLYRKSDQAVGEDIFMCMGLAGYTRFRRSHFHAALLKELPSRTKTFTSKRLVSYTEPSNQSEPIELHFQDGTTATCDILIGADGIKSAVRATMYTAAAEQAEKEGRSAEATKLRSHIKARFSGVEVFRTVIPADKLREFAPNHHAFQSPTQHIMSYPIQSENSKVVNIGIYKCDYTREGDDYPEPWVTDVSSEHLASLYPGWEPDVQAILKCVDPVVSRWAICTVTGLPFFNASRVVLLGDAHAMTNFQGAGAGQAIEDAYILSTILSHPSITRENVTKALEIYSEIRVPFSRHVLESSRATGVDCALHDERMQAEMEWAWTWRPEDEQKKALDLVEKTLG
ncbi:FAD/NAD-P-binding domain-containing protein [Mucidula mucida]|nr:FAD/NAD-P-binding domain-containing protein [Mucidula mucida]